MTTDANPREIFSDCWQFEAGEPVPGWLEHHEGLMQLTWAVAVTVCADLDGRFWVYPTFEPADTMVTGLGYGPDVPVLISGQGRHGVVFLSEPPIDLESALRTKHA